MDEKLNNIIYEFERVTGKTAENVLEMASAKTSSVTKTNGLFKFLKNPRFNFDTLLYIYLPVLIVIFLAVFRPNFLYVKREGKPPVFSVIRLVAFSVIFWILIIIANYLRLSFLIFN